MFKLVFLNIKLYIVSCTNLDIVSARLLWNDFESTTDQGVCHSAFASYLSSFKFLRRFDVVPYSLFMNPHSIESKKAFLLFYIWQSFLTWSLGFYEVVKMHFEHFAINLTHPTSSLSIMSHNGWKNILIL